MKRPFPGPTGFLAIFLCVTACAGGPDFSTLPPSDMQSESDLLFFTEPEAENRWQRPSHPESNAVFRTIDDKYYYLLNPADEVELTLSLGDGPQTFPLRIGPAGEIRLPGYLFRESITIGGLTIPEAEERLATFLTGSLRHPFPALRITAYQGATVTLIGEVLARETGLHSGEGLYTLEGRTTLRDFILTNTSFSENADISAIVITDAQGRFGIFDLNAAIYAADESQNPVLDRGDVILVPSTSVTRNRIFVLGEVVTQSILQPYPGMTVLDAIVSAGGPKDRARKAWIQLVRGRGEEAELFKVPFRRAMNKGDMNWNTQLEPGDIIYIGRSPYDSVSSFFRDSWATLQAGVLATILIDNLKR